MLIRVPTVGRVFDFAFQLLVAKVLAAIVFYILYEIAFNFFVIFPGSFYALKKILDEDSFTTGTVCEVLWKSVPICLTILFVIFALDRLLIGRGRVSEEKGEIFDTVTSLGDFVLTVTAFLLAYYSFFETRSTESIEGIDLLVSLGVFYVNLSLKIYRAIEKAWKKSGDWAEESETLAETTKKQGLAGGSRNPLEEAGNSCLRASRSEHHRDYRSRRRRTEPFSLGKRRSYRASAVLTWRRPQRGSSASAADVQQTTGFQEPSASPVIRPENITQR